MMNFVITLYRSSCGSTSDFDNVITKFMINNRTDAFQTDSLISNRSVWHNGKHPYCQSVEAFSKFFSCKISLVKHGFHYRLLVCEGSETGSK